MIRSTVFYFSLFICIGILSLIETGCANVGMPTGGPRDSLAPTLKNANPALRSVSTEPDKITLVFSEYVEVVEAQTNVIVSPLQEKTPNIRFNLNTVTVKLKDSLLPNTTYSINFGNSIKDVNEGNIFRDFIYTFSTGPYIDSLSINGRVMMANTGMIDSTLQVFLYQDKTDTAIVFQKPKYIAKVNGSGEFAFNNLPSASFRIYVLKDTDGSRTYNSKKELFGFYPGNLSISTKDSVKPFTLYAYAEEETSAIPGAAGASKTAGRTTTNYLRIASPPSPKQDLYSPARISFSGRLKDSSLAGLSLTDTNYRRLNGVRFLKDSTGNEITINGNFSAGEKYFILADKNLLIDESNKKLFKSDTLSFTMQSLSDYGRLTIEFKNFNEKSATRFQILSGENVVVDTLIKNNQWKYERLGPGEYILRILYDDNGNGKWDAGNFKLLKQPERIVQLPNKLAIRANWDNEISVEL